MSPTATLPEYQQYLLSRKLVPEKNVSCYAHWVSLYLAFSNRQENKDKVDMLPRFLDGLQSRKHMDEWQVQQAREAVQLYLGQFLADPSYPLGSTRDDTLTPTLSLKGEKDEVGSTSCGAFDPDSVLARMREAIRIKHYSYSTERSYIDWIKRFFEYTGKVKGGTIRDTPGVADIRDFLSHLAVRLKVSASMQNQAFNALLFLFRSVLNIEISDLNSNRPGKAGGEAAHRADRQGSEADVFLYGRNVSADDPASLWVGTASHGVVSSAGQGR